MQSHATGYPQQGAPQPHSTGYPQQGAPPPGGAPPPAYPPPPQTTYTTYSTQNAYGAGGGQVIQSQPGRTVVIQQTVPYRQGARVYEKYPAKASLVCGGLQVALGILMVILNVVAICISASFVQSFTTAILLVISGSFGILAGKTSTRCPVITFMVMSIISALACIPVLAVAAAGAACDADQYECRDIEEYENWHTTSQEARVAVNAILAITGGVAGIVAIVSSALCCMGACCNSPTTTTMSTAGAVIANPGVQHGQYVTTTTQYAPGQPAPGTYGQPAPGTYGQPAPGTYGVTNTAYSQSSGEGQINPFNPTPPSYSGQPPDYTSVAEEKQRI